MQASLLQKLLQTPEFLLVEANADYNINTGTPLEITVYTDPLCCWSWGAIPHWDKLKKLLGEDARWFLRMGGLIPSWSNYNDEINSISRPAQMGPVWMHAAQLTGIGINSQVWRTDPPASSYPACLAVKAANLQSAESALEYFRLVQYACMHEGKNIAKGEVLNEVAVKLSFQNNNFDAVQFAVDINGEAALEAFRNDLKESQQYSITRFPTLIIRSGSDGLRIAGFHTAEHLFEIISNGIPGFKENIVQGI